jgi:hypothetical protein
MNRHLINKERQLMSKRVFSSKPSIVLPPYELEKQQFQQQQKQLQKEQQLAPALNGLDRLCNILMGLPVNPPPAPIVEVKPEVVVETPTKNFTPEPVISKVDKLSKTPSQIKGEIEKAKRKEADAELINQELNKPPAKPAERLLNKLVKKHSRKKLPSHIKKAIKDIREFEKKKDTQLATNNKILDAIKSTYM